MIPESNVTFSELTEWYLGLNKVRKLAMFEIVKIHLAKFNAALGERAGQPVEKNQRSRTCRPICLDDGLSKSYIDQTIGSARTMVTKAFDDLLISGDCLYPFKKGPETYEKERQRPGYGLHP